MLQGGHRKTEEIFTGTQNIIVSDGNGLILREHFSDEKSHWN